MVWKKDTWPDGRRHVRPPMVDKESDTATAGLSGAGKVMSYAVWFFHAILRSSRLVNVVLAYNLEVTYHR